jgi:hypothetical protein
VLRRLCANPQGIPLTFRRRFGTAHHVGRVWFAELLKLALVRVTLMANGITAERTKDHHSYAEKATHENNEDRSASARA